MLECEATNNIKNAYTKSIEDYLGGTSFVGAFVVWLGHRTGVGICDPKIVEELYTTKNM